MPSSKPRGNDTTSGEAGSVLEEFVDGLPLLDHHCHGVVRTDLDRAGFESLASESDWPAPLGQTHLDSQAGIAIRAICAPPLDLPRHIDAATYLRRRAELGADEVNRRLLRATGIRTYFVETGYRGSEVLTPQEIADVAGAEARTVIRLERVAEELAETGVNANSFIRSYTEALAGAAADAVAVKTIIAYRYGLDFDPSRPSPRETAAAAAEWLHDCEQCGSIRLDHPVLLRAVLWAGVDLGKPIQFHVGYGDSDIVMHRCDPTKMTGFLRATRGSGVQVMLLHCYPFQREAGYLAHVYPHVWLDTGAAISYTGPNSLAVVRESLEVAPFGKVLFSTDGFGLPELYLCGARLWRRAVGLLLKEWLSSDWLSPADAQRYAANIASGNACLAYGLEQP
jgi:predicted TIM-barrel fold metal-dependent hydrolase